MPDQMTPAQFAASIKAKYPVYANVPDAQLVARMLEKYPVYRDRIAGDLPDAATRGMMPMSTQTTDDRTPRQREAAIQREMMGGALDAVKGAGAGLASTVFHGGDLVRRALGMERVIDTPEVQRVITPPDSIPGRVGYTAEQAAEYLVPAVRVARATRSMPFLARTGMEALAASGVAGVQTSADPDAMTAAGVGGAVIPFAGKVAGAVGRTVQRAAAGAKDGGVGGAIAGAVRTVAPSEARTMVFQALKPRSTKTNFLVSVDRALPEIKAAEAAIGKPIDGIDTLLEATTAAKRTIQDQLNVMRGQSKPMQVDLSSVADAMQRSIPSKVRLENPAAAARMREMADVYRRRFTLGEAETLLRETNAELSSFYQMYPQAQRAATTANPATAGLEAQAKALRDAVYGALDAPGQGAAARELNRRYGALLDVEGEAIRRANVAKRQQPESLSEQIGAVRAAADMARGTWRLIHGDLSGAADVAAASAGRSTAKAIKESQTTDTLIRRAFEGFKGRSAPVAMPQARPVRGALPPGPVVTPPPADPSFVRGVPAQPALSGRPRQLPPGRTVYEMPGEVTPPKPDPSGGGSVKAAPIAYDINPTLTVKAGGFRVAQFSGDPAAAKAAVATPEVREMLQRMADDLDVFAPERGGMWYAEGDLRAGDPFINRPNIGGGQAHYQAPVPGSPVGDDIRVISEQNVGNKKIQAAIEDLLAGKTPTNRLHTAALDAAMGYLEKRPGYRGPSIPSGFLRRSSADDEEFEAFSRVVDELADE